MGKELFKNIPSKVGDLVKDVRNGRIGLPDLQRPFVWRDNKVRELFDSMLKGYPIGYITLEQLQSFFLHLVDHTEYYDRHVALVQNEERALSNLEMCCRYYIEHQPNKYFGKYSIKTWYQKWYEKRMNDARETLSELESIYNAVFPVKAYYSDVYQYYPIILKDIDITDAPIYPKLYISKGIHQAHYVLHTDIPLYYPNKEQKSNYSN